MASGLKKTNVFWPREGNRARGRPKIRGRDEIKKKKAGCIRMR
jgi:hypothetical protein